MVLWLTLMALGGILCWLNQAYDQVYLFTEVGEAKESFNHFKWGFLMLTNESSLGRQAMVE